MASAAIIWQGISKLRHWKVFSEGRCLKWVLSACSPNAWHYQVLQRAAVWAGDMRADNSPSWVRRNWDNRERSQVTRSCSILCFCLSHVRESEHISVGHHLVDMQSPYHVLVGTGLSLEGRCICFLYNTSGKGREVFYIWMHIDQEHFCRLFFLIKTEIGSCLILGTSNPTVLYLRRLL